MGNLFWERDLLRQGVDCYLAHVTITLAPSRRADADDGKREERERGLAHVGQ